MTIKSRQKLIGVVMVASIIWAATNFTSEDKKAAVPEKPRTIQPLSPDQMTQSTTTALNPKVVEEYKNKEWGKSPFVSTYVTTDNSIDIFKPESVVWNLSGIIYNNSSPLAIINKRPVKIGETIEHAEVIAIEKNEVILKIDDKQIRLTVSKG